MGILVCTLTIHIYTRISFFQVVAFKKRCLVFSNVFSYFLPDKQQLVLLEHNGYAHSLVRITGIYGLLLYTPLQIFLLDLNVLINLFILGYLYERRTYFYLERRRELKDG